MGYQGENVFISAGNFGQVSHENRLRSQLGELLDAEGVTYADDHIKKESGADLLDGSGLANAAGHSATQSGGTRSTLDLWIDSVFAYPCTDATPFVREGGGVFTTTTGTTSSFPVPAAGHAAGNLFIVTASIVASGTPASVSSVLPAFATCTDSKGNTYTRLNNRFAEAETGSGTSTIRTVLRTSTFATIISTPLVNGDTVTVTQASSTSLGRRVGSAEYEGVVSASPLAQGEASGSSNTLTASITGISQSPILLVAGMTSANSDDQTITPGASFSASYNDDAQLPTIGQDVQIHHRLDTTTPTIIGLYDWHSETTYSITGTVDTTAGSATVSGTGTTFTTEVAVGDKIVIGGDDRIVQSITDNDTLTTTEVWSTANAGATATGRVGNKIITASSTGNLFKSAPVTLTTVNLDAVTLESGLVKTIKPAFFVAGGKEAAADNRKLFFFNGADPVHVLSGNAATTAPIANPPSDWDTGANPAEQPVAGVIHENRLLAWGNLNDPHRVYFSSPDDHEDFTTDPFSIRFASHIGDRIFCGLSFQGVLFLWKNPRGIFYLDDTSISVEDWSYRVKSHALGCAPSPHAALAMDDDIIFMTEDGSFHLLSAVSDLGGVRTSNLSRILGLQQWIKDNIELSKLHLVTSYWDAPGKIAYFGVPGTGDSTNTLTLRFDFALYEPGRALTCRFSYSRRDGLNAITGYRPLVGGATTPIIGESGQVYILNQTDTNKNGVGYVGAFQTPHLDFGDAEPSLRGKRKNYAFLELIFSPVTAGEVNVEVYVNETLKQTLTYDATLRRQRKPLHVGSGHTISIRVENEVLDEDFKVLGMIVGFTPGNEDQTSAS